MNMVNTKNKSTEVMIHKLQGSRGKTNLKFYKKRSNYYNDKKYKNFQTQEDPFSKNARGTSKIYHEVLLLMKFLQNKPQVKNMNINFYDLYYTVIKTRDQKDNNENQYKNFNDFMTPNHYIGIKPRETILR